MEIKNAKDFTKACKDLAKTHGLKVSITQKDGPEGALSKLDDLVLENSPAPLRDGFNDLVEIFNTKFDPDAPPEMQEPVNEPPQSDGIDHNIDGDDVIDQSPPDTQMHSGGIIPTQEVANIPPTELPQTQSPVPPQQKPKRRSQPRQKAPVNLDQNIIMDLFSKIPDDDVDGLKPATMAAVLKAMKK